MNTRLLILALALGALLAYVDGALGLHTMLVEFVHASVVTAIWLICWQYQQRNPQISPFGWRLIVWGTGLLALGSWIDVLDDPPVVALMESYGIGFGRSWEQAFLKKVLGYTTGTVLIALGFLRWVPWMLATRQEVEGLNHQLSQTNKHLKALYDELDARVESERLTISRELHDDVAQELTAQGFQVQLVQRQLQQAAAQVPAKVHDSLQALAENNASILRSVRDISRNLRPETLYAIGFIAALEAFTTKLQQQYPGVRIVIDATENHEPVAERLESQLNDMADIPRLHLFRAIQECIRNAIKHSKAKQIEVIFCHAPQHITIQIQDNGQGFPWTTMPSDDWLVHHGHLGLVGLKERLLELGGSVRLENRVGPTGGCNGACVSITLPHATSQTTAPQ
jgi:signal transduction histidine kinase